MVSDVSPSDWDAYVAAHPDAVAYHQHAWRGVFERAFRHETIYLAARRGPHIAGILPIVAFRSLLFGRFAVSLPFVNYGGLLGSDADAERALIQHAVDLAAERRWSHVELRHFSRRCPQWPARQHKVTMWRELAGEPDALWSSLDRKVRNLVRKAEKSGCVAEHGGAELLPAFYRVFAHNMRDLGTPVYHRRWFREILDAFPADARVFVVRVGGEPVAASITMRWRDRVEVPWASSLRAHSDKAPNMLLYWAMLQQAVAERTRVFDFGRSTPNEGTYRFKEQWGATPTPLVWEYVGSSGAVPDHSPANARFRTAIAAWQRLPVDVATVLGPHIVRNIP